MAKAMNQCSRCGHAYPASVKVCPTDGVSLVKQRFTMNAERIKAIHVLALSQKGLTEEQYKDRMMGITGKSTCKDLRAHEYRRLMASLGALPDSPAWKNKRRRAA